MADDLVLGADVSQLLTALEAVWKGFNDLYSIEERVLRQTQQLNVETGKLTNTWTLTAGKGKTATVTFAQLNDAIIASSVAVKGETVALDALQTELDQIRASMVSAALSAGNFKNAMEQASRIKTPAIKEEAISKVTAMTPSEAATAPIDLKIVKNLQRNLSRGFEDTLRLLPQEAQLAFKQVEEKIAESGVRMGRSWQQIKNQIERLRVEGPRLIKDPEEAGFQKLLMTYNKGIDQIKLADLRLNKSMQDEALKTKGVQQSYLQQQLDGLNNFKNQTLRADVFSNLKKSLDNLVTPELPQRIQERLSRSAAAFSDFAARNKISVEQAMATIDRLRAGGPLQIFDPKSTDYKLQQLGSRLVSAEQDARKFRGGIDDIARATRDYDAFLGQLNNKLVTITDQQTKTASSGNKIIESYRGITAQGEQFTATARKVNGQIVAFDKTVTGSAAATQEAVVAQQRLTLAQQDANKFLGQLSAGTLQQLSYTKQYSSETGRLNETYNTLNKSGQQQITTIARQGDAIKGFTQVTYDQSKANEQLYLSWQSIIRLFTVQLIHQAVSSMLAGVQQSVEAAKNLQIQVAQIQTISESGFNTQKWVDGIMSISNATGLLASDVASGLYDTLSNQIADGGRALEFMNTAGKFAIATNTSMKDSINAISSALNSYGLGIDQASKVSDVFFRMIDLGRIQAKDFANEIGRLFPLAEQLGIRIEEVAAVLSVLTRAGVTPASAMTSLFNIMTRLIKPAGEMKDFLKGMGVDSSQAAIGMTNFAQVLGKIADFTKGRPELLAQLFPDIRGLRAMARLGTESGIKEVNKDLQAMDEAVGAVDKAITNFNNNAGKQFQIQMEQIRNYFTQAWGQNIIETIMLLTKHTIELSDAVKIATNALVFLGGPVVLGGFIELIRASQVASTALAAMSAGALGPLALVAAALVGISVQVDKYANSLEEAQKKEEDAYETAIKAANAAIEKGMKPLDEAISNNFKGLRIYVAEMTKAYDKAEEELVKNAESAKDKLGELNNEFKQYIGNLLETARQQLRGVESDIKRLRELGPKLIEDLRLAKLAVALDRAKEDPVTQQKLLNEELKRTADLINQTNDVKQAEDYYKTAADLIKQIAALDSDYLKQQEKIADKRQKLLDSIAAREQKLKELKQKGVVTELSDIDKLDKLRKKKGQTVVTIKGEVVPTNLQTGLLVAKEAASHEKLKRQIADEEKALARARQELEKIKDVELVTTDIVAKRVDLYDLMQKKREELLKIATQDEIINKKQIDDLEIISKKISTAFNEINKFKFDKLLKVEDIKAFDILAKEQKTNLDNYRELVISATKKDFKSRATMLQQIDAMERQLITARQTFIQEQNARNALELINALEKEAKLRREALVAQQQNQSKIVAGFTEQIKQAAPAFKKEIDFIGSALPDVIREDVKNSLDRLIAEANRQTIQVFTQAYLRFKVAKIKEMEANKIPEAQQKTLWESIEEAIGAPLVQIGVAASKIKSVNITAETMSKEVTDLQTEIDKQIDSLSETLKLDLRKIKLQTESNEIQKSNNQLLAELRDALKAMKGGLIGVGGKVPVIPMEKPVEVPINVEKLNEEAKRAAESQKEIEARQVVLDEIARKGISSEVDRLLETGVRQQETINNATVNQTVVTDKITQSATTVSDSVIKAANSIGDYTKQLLTTQVQPTEVNIPYTGPVETFARGGMVRGQDNIPALLSKGEFVVSAAATRRFYSQLINMNRVQTFGQGGLVTNVGDINVSLQSTGSVQSDIVEIGKGLQREIRRGRLKFA